MRLKCLSLIALAIAVAPDSLSAAVDLTVFRTKYGGAYVVRERGTALQTLVGRSLRPADDLVRASDVVEAIRPALGLDALSSLHYGGVFESRGARHIKYFQRWRGFRLLLNGRLTISLANDGRITSVVNETMRLRPVPPKPAVVTPAEILQYLAKFFQYVRMTPLLRVDVRGVDIKLVGDEVLYAVDGFMVPAQRFAIVSADPPLHLEFMLSLARVPDPLLDVHDRIYEAWGSGRVFDPNPQVTSQNQGLLYNSAIPAQAYDDVDLLNLNPPNAAGIYTLWGKYVQLVDPIKGEPQADLVWSSNSDFACARGTYKFASVMVYFHVDRMQRYVQWLGFRNVAKDPIQADVTGRQALNAFFHNLPGGPILEFGFDRFFVAEDADVIAHEYGHGLQAAYAFDKYRHSLLTMAMREGFGDYWAISTFRDANERYQSDPTCYAEWSQQTGCSRRIDFRSTANDVGGMDAHAAGGVWAAALWNLLRRVGKPTADTIALESHAHVRDLPNFVDGGLALLSADAAVYQGKHWRQICSVLEEKEIFAPSLCDSLFSITASP